MGGRVQGGQGHREEGREVEAAGVHGWCLADGRAERRRRAVRCQLPWGCVPPRFPIKEAELREWRLLETFGARVAELAEERGVAASWADPRHHLLYGQ